MAGEDGDDDDEDEDDDDEDEDEEEARPASSSTQEVTGTTTGHSIGNGSNLIQHKDFGHGKGSAKVLSGFKKNQRRVQQAAKMTNPSQRPEPGG